MKSYSDLAKDNFKNLKPCVHGADVFEAAHISGIKREDIIDFSSSVNPLGASEKALNAARNSFGQIINYPDSTSAALREAIANHYGGITKDNVIVGNGSTELIYLLADAFLREGDLAVVPAPSFGEYESAVCRAGEKTKHVQLTKDFHVDPKRFNRALTARVKIAYFCNPNNPTSILTPPHVLAEVFERALQKSILVFLDEDFLEFVHEGEKYSFIGRLNEFPNLFILKSFTKIYGLTGLRVGYGIASKGIIDILRNAKIPWNVNCLAQTAAIAALNDKEHLEKTLALITEEKTYLLNKLSKIDCVKVYPPDANFIFIDIRKSGYTSANLKAGMLSQGFLIRDCSSFAGLDNYFVRIAVKTRHENERMLKALQKFLR